MNKLMWMSAAAFAAMLCAGSPDASAVTASGMSGHGWPNHFDTCFGSSWTQMINNCSGSLGATRLLVIPIQVPAPGSYFFNSARAGGNGANGGTTCQAVSIWNSGGAAGFTARVQSSVSTASQTLNLGSLWIPAGGTAHFECDVAQGGGRVYNVELG